MSARNCGLRHRNGGLCWTCLSGTAVLAFLCIRCLSAAEPSTRDRIALGQELFLREWVPDDSRSRGGDGLGPVFNDTSCVACHNLGGIGGGGPATKNVDLISAFANPPKTETVSLGHGLTRILVGLPWAPKKKTPPPSREELIAEMIRINSGFRTSPSVVLHRFGTSMTYRAWLKELSNPIATVESLENAATNATAEVSDQPAVSADEIKVMEDFDIDLAQMELESLRGQTGLSGRERMFDRFNESQQIGDFLLIRSQRNATALFGTGLIDSIPTVVLEEAAQRRFAEFPGITGRVSRLKDGRIGRYGWKAQQASLREFAMTACAVELGLHVPEHAQAGLPFIADGKAPGFDLEQSECDALVDFLRSLDAPQERQPTSARESRLASDGKGLFTKIGCAACHSPRLGAVDGIYSDLLLHDMGQQLADEGRYGPSVPNTSEGEVGQPTLVFAEDEEKRSKTRRTRADDTRDEAQATGALRREWRTPPLWGVRDSAPYLHDGRAATLEEAIALHEVRPIYIYSHSAPSFEGSEGVGWDA